MKNKNKEDVQDTNNVEQGILKRRTLKEIIAPSGIDFTNIDHLEIISNTKRYARSFLFQLYQECVLFLNFLETCIFLEI